MGCQSGKKISLARGASDSTVQSAVISPDWRAGRIARNRQLSLFGYNAALRRASDKAAYPIRVDIATALLAPMRHDVLSEADLPELATVEQVVTHLAAGRAVLAGQFTTVAERRIVAYTGDSVWAKDVAAALQGRITEHPLRVTATSDPQWKLYRLFGKLRRRVRTNALGTMLLVPLAEGVVLAIRLGVGWGLGDAVAIACWLTAVLVPSLTSRPSRSAFQIRSPSDWLARHAGWAFAFFSLVIATVCLIFPALFLRAVLTAWECAATALGLGVVLTLALWPVQRRYFAAIRARATEP
jgi:Family of unknown function (DUF695)